MAKCRTEGLRPISITYSAHMVKVLQLLFHVIANKLMLDDDRLWWWLERFDQRASSRTNGLHLNVVVERE
jgi:hypothetical protein